MADREKLMETLKLCANGEPCMGKKYRACPYSPIGKPEYYNCGAAMAAGILAIIREQTPVVFCGDCKYWNAGTCLNDNVYRQIEDCGCYPDFVTDSSWFCAEGERR